MSRTPQEKLVALLDDGVSAQSERPFPTHWQIEICGRCGETTEYDRDYGGPFPAGGCPFPDCEVNKDGFYGTCPSTLEITVLEKADA